MKKIFILILIISVFNSCKNENTDVLKENNYVIEGTIEENINETASIYFLKGEEKIVDSINIVDGKFSYSNKINQPELAFIYITDKEYGALKEFVLFTEPNKKIKINIQSVKDKKYTVSGSLINDEFFSFTKNYIEPIEQQENKMVLSINPDNIDNQNMLDSLLNLSNQFQHQKKQAVLNYLKAHQNSIVITAYGFWLNSNSNDINFCKNIYTTIDKTTKQSHYGLAIEKVINNTNQLIVGGTIKDFTAVDKNGNNIQLSLLFKRNKLLLLDFWSSRCIPCRKQNPNLVNLYQQYHSKGFEIVGVSVDEDKKNWTNAIEQDKLSWIQICDLKSWEGAIPKQFDITETPTTFLINQKGTIVDINLKGEALQTKLKTVFN